jgi:hypothetical protein
MSSIPRDLKVGHGIREWVTECLQSIDRLNAENEVVAASLVGDLDCDAVGVGVPPQPDVDAVVRARVELPCGAEVESCCHVRQLLSVVESTGASGEPLAPG